MGLRLAEINYVDTKVPDTDVEGWDLVMTHVCVRTVYNKRNRLAHGAMEGRWNCRMPKGLSSHG